MTFLIPAREDDVLPCCLPSVVLHQLFLKRRNVVPGQLADDGRIDGEVSELKLTSMGDRGQGPPQIEVLTGDHVAAALDLLTAFCGGGLIAYVIIDGSPFQILRKYWRPYYNEVRLRRGEVRAEYRQLEAPRSDAPGVYEQFVRDRRGARLRFVEEIKRVRAIQQSAMLWGEDTVLDHPDRRLLNDDASAIGKAILVNRSAAEDWIETQTLFPGKVESRAVSAEMRTAEAKRVASVLDKEALSERNVRKKHVTAIWNVKDCGPQLDVKSIQHLMKGNGKGGRSKHA